MAEQDFREWLKSIRFVTKTGDLVPEKLEADDSDDPEGDRAEDAQCLTCKWYNGDFSCPAYTRIPNDIWTNITMHDKIFPAQKGKRTYKRR